MLAEPLVGRRKPVIIFMVVDLPAPLGPRKPSTSPRLTDRETPRTASIGPKRFTRSRVAIISTIESAAPSAVGAFLDEPVRSPIRLALVSCTQSTPPPGSLTGCGRPIYRRVVTARNWRVPLSFRQQRLLCPSRCALTGAAGAGSVPSWVSQEEGTAMASNAELIRLTAREAVHRLSKGEVTPLELIDAAVARIEEVEPTVHALPTLCVERARDHARRLMQNRAVLQGGARGWLAGLPIAIKDLNEVAGVRTTHGSPIFADHVPQKSDVVVERLEANGGVVLAKSNTPEFGAGGNTFNEVFGETLNPWNTALTCGGSSGGAAVSLATGEVWLAHGSDHGGSLRTPASFCSVVGLRPSPGRVPHGPGAYAFYDMSVNGPMARNVGDLALFLDAMAGQVLA